MIEGSAAQAPVEAEVGRFVADLKTLKDEVAKMIVGQDDIVDGVLTCLLADGHALLEGVPGLGKTMLVRTLAEAVDLKFSRVQFTPDLMPADILGTNMIQETESREKRYVFQPGPVFCNILLADEINRATPKTQSALLEAMQEKSVTIAKETHRLPPPFFVLATQNPLEMEGTYPLPEAQLDRFMFKLLVKFPSRGEMHAILDRTTRSDTPEVAHVIQGTRIVEMRKLVRQVPVAKQVQDYAIRVLQATHPGSSESLPVTQKYLRFGSSPRGAQSILLGAKIKALLDGRFSASCDDIRKVAPAAMRHRLILNFEGEAEGVSTDDIIDEILALVPEHKE
jgi:MoxR-like ATPase